MFVVAVLWTAFFIINFNIAMMIPLLPFIERAIGLSPAQAATILAAFPIAALVSNLAIGPLIDRYGRRRFIVFGAAASAASFLATAAAGSAGTIALGRIVSGVFVPMIGASIFAALADYIPVERRARATGTITTAAPIAFLFSMSMGVLLGGLLAWQIPLLILAVICIGLAIAARRLPPTRPEGLAAGRITGATYRNRLLSLSLGTPTRLLLLSYLCWGIAVYTFLGLYPTWLVQHGLVQHGTAAIGVLLFVGEIGGLLGALAAGRLAGRFRHPLSLCAMAALLAGIVVLIVPATSGFPVPAALAYLLFAFGRDMMLALILGGAMQLVEAAQRGSLNAVMNAIYQTGGTMGGIASAWLYSARPDFWATSGVSAMLFAGAAAMLFSITRSKA